jgi:hypothetical protein
MKISMHCIHSRIQCKAAPKKNPDKVKKKGLYTEKKREHDIPSKTDMSKLET